MRNRKNQHKTRCNNENDKGYNTYVYKFIRNNGGWNNWQIIELETIECESKKNSLKIERKYIEDLHAELNKEIPSQTMEEWKIKNKEKISCWFQDYYQNNKEILDKYKKEYNEKNKLKNKEYRHNYWLKNNK